jgi:hypothetical protein
MWVLAFSDGWYETLLPLPGPRRVSVHSDRITLHLAYLRGFDYSTVSEEHYAKLAQGGEYSAGGVLGFTYTWGEVAITGAAAPADPNNLSRAVKFADYVIEFGVPAPLLLVVLLVPPLRRLSREHRVRRAKQAQMCLNCGYDLRATPDRCPECGVAPSGTVVVGQVSPYSISSRE